jgi:hypothetical protein
MITVYIAGLIYHHGCDVHSKWALVPDGTKFDPPHYASIFVEKKRVKKAVWWGGDQQNENKSLGVMEFRIPTRAVVTFPDDAEDGAHFRNLSLLPTLHDNPGWEIDLVNPETIAEVPIRSGRLTAYAFDPAGEERVAVVKWKFANKSNEVKIKARTLHETKSLTLYNSKGLEIVFSNTAELGRAACSHVDPHHSHFVLYDKLNKKRPMNPPPKPPDCCPDLDPLKYSHPYLKHLHDAHRLGDVGCTPTCC